MCMDNGPFLLVQGEKETPLDHTASILAAKDAVKLVDLVGQTTVLKGTIIEIDLLNRRIVLSA